MTPDQAAGMTTTELLHLIETRRLPAADMRIIRAELKSREI